MSGVAKRSTLREPRENDAGEDADHRSRDEARHDLPESDADMPKQFGVLEEEEETTEHFQRSWAEERPGP